MSIHNGEMSRKIMYDGDRNSYPIACLQDGHQETSATKTADTAGLLEGNGRHVPLKHLKLLLPKKTF